MKRTILLALLFALVLSCAGCSSETPEPTATLAPQDIVKGYNASFDEETAKLFRISYSKDTFYLIGQWDGLADTVVRAQHGDALSVDAWHTYTDATLDFYASIRAGIDDAGYADTPLVGILVNDLDTSHGLLRIEGGVITYDATTENGPVVPSPVPEESNAAEPNDGTPTMGESNALKKAESYLSISAFSKSSLKEQLMYSKFTESEADYAVEHCGADWNEQALKKAESYLSHSAFSASGLKGQLEYEGFTAEEATYGVEHCGADWYDQAAAKAKSYLSHSSFSYQGLVDQLLYEGFTDVEAVYGAVANGLSG